MANQVTIDYERSFSARFQMPQAGSLMIGAPCQGGKAEVLSPKDLFAAAYGSCVIMSMDIGAKKSGFDIDGASIAVSPVWPQDKSRLAEVNATVVLPAELDEDQLDTLRKGAHTCPIHNSLGPEVKTTLTFKVA